MPDIDFNFYSIIISILALVLSAISLWRTRKTIDVTIEDELDDIQNIYISSHDFLTNKPYYKIPEGKLLFIKIVNPSPTDIGFFDLQLFDQNNQKISYFVHGNFRVSDTYQPNTVFFNKQKNGPGGRLNLLESNYGVLPSNSFTRIDIPFSATDVTKITITFKVAIKSYWFNKYARYRKHYRFFSKTLPIYKDQT